MGFLRLLFCYVTMVAALPWQGMAQEPQENKEASLTPNLTMTLHSPLGVEQTGYYRKLVQHMLYTLPRTIQVHGADKPPQLEAQQPLNVVVYLPRIEDGSVDVFEKDIEKFQVGFVDGVSETLNFEQPDGKVVFVFQTSREQPTAAPVGAEDAQQVPAEQSEQALITERDQQEKEAMAMAFSAAEQEIERLQQPKEKEIKPAKEVKPLPVTQLKPANKQVSATIKAEKKPEPEPEPKRWVFDFMADQIVPSEETKKGIEDLVAGLDERPQRLLLLNQAQQPPFGDIGQLFAARRSWFVQALLEHGVLVGSHRVSEIRIQSETGQQLEVLLEY